MTTAVALDDRDHLYVVDQIGKLWVLPVAPANRGHGPAAPPVAPTLAPGVSARQVALGVFGVNYDERGFLDVAFQPNFRHNSLLYTFTSEPPAMPADFSMQPTDVLANHQTAVTEWRAMSTPDDEGSDGGHPAKPITVDPNSSRVLLRIDKPQFKHEGGTLAFGRAGYLYITLGNGGSANDFGPGHSAGGNAQDLTNLLGKILRIDPRGLRGRLRQPDHVSRCDQHAAQPGAAHAASTIPASPGASANCACSPRGPPPCAPLPPRSRSARTAIAQCGSRARTACRCRAPAPRPAGA